MTARKPPSDEQLREAFSEVGDALQRAVVLSSDRVQSVFEDAVLRGRMTRRDAEELASSLVALGRDQALELRGEVDALATSFTSKVAATVDPLSKRRKKKQQDDEGDGDAAEPAASASSATPDPSTMSAKDVIALVTTLSPADLATLREQEAAGKARATVLKAIDTKTRA